MQIKAHALREAGMLDEARTLLLRVTTADSASNAASATEALGDLARQEDRPAEAEAYYRSVLERWPSLNGTSHMVEVSLAELLIEHDQDDAHTEALQLLESRLKRSVSMFDHDLFRWHVALARVAVRRGDVETQQRAARTASTLAKRGPQLPRHPTVGLVQADASTLTWLEQLAPGVAEE
jgi:predicted Zn-dependent protease